MINLFRPIDFNKPDQIFWDAFQIIALSAILGALIIFSLALWVIAHPPKFHKSSYAAYYSLQEYKKIDRQNNQLVIPAKAETEENNNFLSLKGDD